MINKVKKERCACKKENLKKSLKGNTWAVGLAAVRGVPNRKRPVEDLVAFLICQSMDMDIICCHISQSKE